MVDYVITAANVKPTGSLGIQSAIAAATITAGQVVRAIGGTVTPAQADSIPNSASVVGVALNGGATGQPVNFVTGGTVEVGTAFAIGDVVVLSAGAAGAMAPVADLSTGNVAVILGVATTTDILKIGLNNSGVAKT